MIIGKIVKSNSHIDYLCRVNDRLESANPPRVEDYTFGKFIKIELTESDRNTFPAQIVGVIYNSQLVNPEFGNYGPRLTTPPDQNAVFSPDYVNEQFTLVGILLLGWFSGSKGVHRIPPNVLPLNAGVEPLAEDDFKNFHLNGKEELHLNYYSHVITHAGKLGPQLLQTILDQLRIAFGDRYASMIDILRDTLSWQMTMATLK